MIPFTLGVPPCRIARFPVADMALICSHGKGSVAGDGIVKVRTPEEVFRTVDAALDPALSRSRELQVVLARR